MGYYLQNRYYETISIRSKSEGDNYIKNNIIIDIINNEKISFDFNGYSSNDETLSGDIITENAEDSFRVENDTNNIIIENDRDIIRNAIRQISIDYKDGSQKEVLIQPTPYKKDWMKCEHKFSFKEGIDEGFIEINIWLFYKKEPEKFEIPFIVHRASSRIQGIELRLVDAKLTNDKKISYIFEDKNTNQVFLASYQGNL